MHPSNYSLRQIDDAYIQSLDIEGLRHLSSRLLADLHEAWERLNQGPTNSSRPPGSRAPWERGETAGAEVPHVTATPPPALPELSLTVAANDATPSPSATGRSTPAAANDAPAPPVYGRPRWICRPNMPRS